MANLVITKTGNIVNVDFGNYSISGSVDGKCASYQINDISIVWMEKTGEHVRIKMKDAITTTDWSLVWQDEGNGGFVVDTVDGVTPTSNTDLMGKINAIR